MENLLNWIRLQAVFGQGNIKVRRVISRYGSPSAFFEQGASELSAAGELTAAEKKRIQTFTDRNAQDIVDACRRLEISILTPDDAAYPERLRNIPDYPAVLYISGELGEIDDEVAIAVVGTRNISPYGKQMAHHLSLTLAKAGAVIVSGGAYGVDSYAHQGALMAKGRTIAVLGCGIDINYPAGNAEMRRQITQNGALVSEYPPGVTALPQHFPIRNRLMSALSLGTLVVEANIRSGSLITANRASDQGRDVFAVPGDVTSEYSEGCHHLIKQGAKPVSCAMDILSEYLPLYPHRLDMSVPGIYHTASGSEPVPYAAELPFTAVRSSGRAKRANSRIVARKPSPQPAQEQAEIPEDLSEPAKKLLGLLQEEPVHVDRLAAKAGLPSFRAAPALTELELLGLALPHSGRRFSKG